MSSTGPQESRGAQRRKVHWRALIVHADWRCQGTHIVNISESGTCIVSPDSRPAGTVLRIVLFAPDLKSSGRVMPLMLDANVIYSILAADGFQLGVQFLRPDAAAIDHIRAVLRR